MKYQDHLNGEKACNLMDFDLILAVQMGIGRKWKEVIDVTDKISYSFHVNVI